MISVGVCVRLCVWTRYFFFASFARVALGQLPFIIEDGSGGGGGGGSTSTPHRN